MSCVIFTGGELIKSDLVTNAIKNADMILAADGGACKGVEFGVLPKAIIGDFDSIDAKTKHQLKQRQVEMIVASKEKDETDTQLAIEYAIKKGASEITILGGIMGDRIDHVLGNILYASIASVPIRFVNGLQTVSVAKGPATISLQGKRHDLVSLLSFAGDCIGMKSTGLQWELKNETLLFGKPRGVSNVFLQDHIEIVFQKGLLVIVHTTQS